MDGALSEADKIKFAQFIKDLDEFEAEGKRYYAAQSELQKIKSRLTSIKNNGIINNSVADAFSQARKDAALWAKTTKEADDKVREVCGVVWKQSAQANKKAAYSYTCGSGRFNRPLSGYRKPFDAPGGGWEKKYFKGINKVWIDYEGAGDEIRALTDMIDLSSYDFDMWLQRGSDFEALEAHLGLNRGSLSKMTQSEIQRFAGKDFTNYAFTSTAVNKGSGFSGDIIWNIYAPQGTKMVYAEPFSRYGSGSGLNWDGISKQKSFGGEAEMIIQRGAIFKIKKIEKKGSKIFMDVEVHPEKGYELIQQNPAEWTGGKEAYR
jgi:hypothetical protein